MAVQRSGAELVDVLVVGGGVAGLACGTALAAAGFKTTVIDAGPVSSFRGELLHPAGATALTNLGLRPALLAAGAVPVIGFAAYRGGVAEPVQLPYPVADCQGLAIEHGALVACLRQDFLARAGTELISGKGDEPLVEEGQVVGIRCADGTERRARLVIGADGRHSRVRTKLKFPTEIVLPSFTLAPDLEGDLLPCPDHGHVFLGGPGPIVAYAYAHRRVRMCIDIPAGVGGGRKGLAAYVRTHYASCVPEPLRSAMLDAVDRGAYAGSANHVITTKHCVTPGLALVGDACGCSHPVTATGLTTALHDVETLAECLSAQGLTQDALLTYERRRYRYARARETFSAAFFELARGEGAGARGLREGMFQYWTTSHRAKRASMAILSGDDSRPQALAREYGTVMARSAWAAVRRDSVRSLPADLRAMLVTAGGCLESAVEKTVDTVALDVRRGAFGGWSDSQWLATASDTELPARADPKSRTTLRRMTGWLYTVAKASRTGERTAARSA